MTYKIVCNNHEKRQKIKGINRKADMKNEAVKYGMRQDLWDSFDEKTKSLYRTVSPLPTSTGALTISLFALNRTLDAFREDADIFELQPDFQRENNAWTREQQISYIENLIRGIAPADLKFNSDNWNSKGANEIERIVCIDGLQRITAMLAFLNNEFAVFGNLKADDLYETPFSPKSIKIRYEMYNLETREELLNFYIKLNSGGTVHTEEEIDRVKQLLEKEKQ